MEFLFSLLHILPLAGIITLPKKLSISSIAGNREGCHPPGFLCLVALVVVVKPLADVSANYTRCDGQ